jgi:hypothetical protein
MQHLSLRVMFVVSFCPLLAKDGVIGRRLVDS